MFIAGGGVGVGVEVGDGVAVGVDVGDGVAVGVGVGVTAVMVMRPLGVAAGGNVSRLSSIKMKLFGTGFQASVLVAPGVLLTLSILRLNSVPDPFSGERSFEKADTRSVFIVPGPVLRMFEETFQLVAVSPAPETGGLWKVTTVS